MFVYFIQGTVSKNIKIGVSRSPKDRIQSIQNHSGESVRLIGTIRGGRELEHIIHKKFDSLRLHGEWFRPEINLIEYIRENINRTIKSKKISKPAKDESIYIDLLKREVRLIKNSLFKYKEPKRYLSPTFINPMQ